MARDLRVLYLAQLKSVGVGWQFPIFSFDSGQQSMGIACIALVVSEKHKFDERCFVEMALEFVFIIIIIVLNNGW